MGKNSRKCGGVGKREVRTRAAQKLALAVAASPQSPKREKAVVREERQISNLELRNRSVILKPRIARSTATSASRRRSCPELGRIFRCPSDVSCEPAVPARSAEELDATTFYSCNVERGEMMASNNPDEGASDPESAAERESRRRSMVVATPSETELEDFFAAAEIDLRRRFTQKYNFDVVEDVPLAGRYDWIPLTP
ncbi:cyclin-dependent kinase inhibitor 5-like [Musa acuminata AAA Group]|uniref:cyclin-dependent kinase inhibitor 5-like n=1 Tax=Musa acuminata AAA Group TaxID=214697 RepID=UPI0031D640CF